MAKFPPHGRRLLNNAGSFDGDYTGERVMTAEGNEYTFAVNVLAPFLLTALLLSSLKASRNGRVAISSSVSMGAANALDDLQLASGYSGHRAYSLSKLCDAMISQVRPTRSIGRALTGAPPRPPYVLQYDACRSCMHGTEIRHASRSTRWIRRSKCARRGPSHPGILTLAPSPAAALAVLFRQQLPNEQEEPPLVSR